MQNNKLSNQKEYKSIMISRHLKFDNIQSIINKKELREMSKNWCFVCEKQFQLSSLSPKECPTCKQQAYEQITPQSRPEQFQVYQQVRPPNVQPSIQPLPQNVPNPMQSPPMNIQTGLIQPIIGLSSIITNAINQNSMQSMSNPQQQAGNISNGPVRAIQVVVSNYGSQLPQILNFSQQIFNFMSNLVNSGQSYRRATEAEINALQKVQKAHQCAICQSQNQSGGFKLRCGHQFHEECIRPWFERANTCPTCRDTL